MAYNHPAFPAFILTFGAFVLLILTTFSIPWISSFYFLHTTMSGGVRFGIWGWCLDLDQTCTSSQLGYSWDPQLVHSLTPALIFYPIATGFTFIGVVALIPLLCSRSIAVYQYGVFSAIALISFIASFIAFVFTISLWGIAKHRFQQAGFTASFGPLPWMSLAAMIALLIVTVNSGCGTSVLYCSRWRKQARSGPTYNY